MLSQDSEDEIRSRFAFALAIWLWQDELNPRVRCAFGNVFFILLTLFMVDDNPYDHQGKKGLRSQAKARGKSTRCLPAVAPQVWKTERTLAETESVSLWGSLKGFTLFSTSVNLSKASKRFYYFLLFYQPRKGLLKVVFLLFYQPLNYIIHRSL